MDRLFAAYRVYKKWGILLGFNWLKDIAPGQIGKMASGLMV